MPDWDTLGKMAAVFVGIITIYNFFKVRSKNRENAIIQENKNQEEIIKHTELLNKLEKIPDKIKKIQEDISDLEDDMDSRKKSSATRMQSFNSINNEINLIKTEN